MSRAKQYDRIELLERAIELFRKQGFNGTSTAELVEELGVNRKSMYAEFGSKQGLFEAALERYDQFHLSRVLAAIESPDAGVDEIRQAFEAYAAASEGPYRGLGCLMCNTAVERAALDPASGEFVAGYMERFTNGFASALGNAREAGKIASGTDIDQLAGFLTTSMIGIAASIRAKASQRQVWATYEIVKRVLDEL
jgi:TetR/AcrR family transcriptional repressor of nem operon